MTRTALGIALIVLGLLLTQVLMWILIVRWMRRTRADLAAAVRADLEERGERIWIGPEPGLYGGGTGGHPRVKGNAVIALTDRRLHIRRFAGAPIAVERARIVGACEREWYRGSYKGSPFVVLSLAGGDEIAFIVGDRRPWLAAFPAGATGSPA